MDNNEILLKTLNKENDLLKNNIDTKENKINELYRKYNELQEEYKKMENQHEKEVKKNEKLLEEKIMIENKLNSILYSRSYKITQKIKKILRR